jgi:hypothetical protein
LLLVERFAIVGGSRSRRMVDVLVVVVCRHHCALGIAEGCIVEMPLACLFHARSHWQQSHSIRWSYIWERRDHAGSFPKHLQWKGVVNVVAKLVASIVAAQIHGGLQMEIRPGMEWRS